MDGVERDTHLLEQRLPFILSKGKVPADQDRENKNAVEELNFHNDPTFLKVII